MPEKNVEHRRSKQGAWQNVLHVAAESMEMHIHSYIPIGVNLITSMILQITKFGIISAPFGNRTIGALLGHLFFASFSLEIF